MVADEDPALVRQGEELFRTSCVSCHGSGLEGVPGMGPSLVGAGEAAVYSQVSTPLARQEAQSHRKPPVFTPGRAVARGRARGAQRNYLTIVMVPATIWGKLISVAGLEIGWWAGPYNSSLV